MMLSALWFIFETEMTLLNKNSFIQIIKSVSLLRKKINVTGCYSLLSFSSFFASVS